MKIRWTAFVLAGFAHLAHAASHTDAKLIARAMSAAPAKVAKDARIVDMDASGHLRELRAGTNGWTCYPHDPGSPRGDAWCLDVNGQAWLDALMAHRAPDPDTIGFSYMDDPQRQGRRGVRLSVRATDTGYQQTVCDVRRHALRDRHFAREVERPAAPGCAGARRAEEAPAPRRGATPYLLT